MKDVGITVNIIPNSWDDYIYDIEQMRVEIKSTIDKNCSYYPCKGVVLMALSDEIIGGNSFKNVLDKYAYILFWEKDIPIHLREEYRAMIVETAKRSGLTHLIDFMETDKNVDGYDYKMELSKKIEDGFKIEENIDTTTWVNSLGIKIDELNCPVKATDFCPISDGIACP